MSDECIKDEDGVCVTHGPGTQGEADSANAVVAGTLSLVKALGARVAKAGVLLSYLADRVDRDNRALAEKGRPLIVNVEEQLEAALRPVAAALLTALEKIEKIHVVGPNAS